MKTVTLDDSMEQNDKSPPAGIFFFRPVRRWMGGHLMSFPTCHVCRCVHSPVRCRAIYVALVWLGPSVELQIDRWPRSRVVFNDPAFSFRKKIAPLAPRPRLITLFREREKIICWTQGRFPFILTKRNFDFNLKYLTFFLNDKGQGYYRKKRLDWSSPLMHDPSLPTYDFTPLQDPPRSAKSRKTRRFWPSLSKSLGWKRAKLYDGDGRSVVRRRRSRRRQNMDRKGTDTRNTIESLQAFCVECNEKGPSTTL